MRVDRARRKRFWSGTLAFRRPREEAIVDDLDPALWFPTDYESSRARFRADCDRWASGSEDFRREWKLGSASDQDLTIDYAFFGGGGDRLLVVQSGIHGSEAQSGAAVQAFVLNNYLTALRAKGIDVAFIHAL